MMSGAVGQMSGSRRPAQTARIESSCASGTLVAQNAAKTRVGRHSWQVDNPRAEEGSDLAGVGEGVKESARAQASCSCGHMVHPGGAGGAPGSEGREDTLGRAAGLEYSRAAGLAHGWDGWDGCRRRVGMVDDPKHGHRLHAGAAHEAPLEVCGSWVAVKIRGRREEGRGIKGVLGDWGQAHSFCIYFFGSSVL